MKIAIFHDYFGSIGGGEKLVSTLARALKGDIITTDIDTESIRKMGFLFSFFHLFITNQEYCNLQVAV